MKIDATIMTTASSPILGSHGDGEKALCLSPQLEIKSGGDDAVVAPKGDEEVDQKPTLVGTGHKRKASTEIDPFCEFDPDSSHGSKRLNSPPVSTLIVERQQQQVDEEMLPLEGGDDNEKMEEDKGVSDGGPLEMDSDQNKGEGLIMNSLNNVEEEKVETEAIDRMNVEPEGDKAMNKEEGTVNSPCNVIVEEEKVETEAIDRMNVEPEGDKAMNKEEGTLNSPCNVIVEEEKVETEAIESMNVEPEGDKGKNKEGTVNSPSNVVVEEEKVETNATESMIVEHDGDKGTSHGRHFELDLNRGVEEIVNSPSYVETETTKVESEDIESMDVDSQGNNGMPRVVRLLWIDLNLEADHQGMMQHSSSDAERETIRVEPEIGDKGMPHEVEQCSEENNEEEDDDAIEVERREVVLVLSDDDAVEEEEKREVMLAFPAVVENEVETSPPPRDYVIDLNIPPPGYNDEN